MNYIKDKTSKGEYIPVVTDIFDEFIAGTYKDEYAGKLQLRKGNDFDILVDKIRGYFYITLKDIVI